jgi:hypothetical protein
MQFFRLGFALSSGKNNPLLRALFTLRETLQKKRIFSRQALQVAKNVL